MVTKTNTKKKIIKKPSKPLPVEEKKEEKKAEPYKPIFPSIKIKVKTRNELNYVAIGRKLRSFIYKSKEEITEENKEPKYLNPKSKFFNFNWKFYLDSAWSEYTDWFNSVFNKKVD